MDVLLTRIERRITVALAELWLVVEDLMPRDLGRFLQPPTHRERAARQRAALAELPARIGPAEFSILGALVAVRCPHDLDRLMKKAGGLWEPGSRRWLIELWRINPLIRDLRRATDPLFRRAGMDLDQPPDGGEGGA